MLLVIGGVSALVGSAPSSAAADQTIFAVEGAPFSGQVAPGIPPCANGNTSHDAGAAYINWGDGSPVTETGASTSGIWGSHTYAEEGIYQGTIQWSHACFDVNSHEFDQGAYGFTATVADAALAVAPGRAVRLVAGVPAPTALGSASDADPGSTPADLRALIRWGDGTASSGRVVHAQQGVSIAGLHAYRRPGARKVTVLVSDHGAIAQTSEQVVVDPAMQVLGQRPTAAGDPMLRIAVLAPGHLTIGELNPRRRLIEPVRLDLRRPTTQRVVLQPTALARRLKSRRARLHTRVLVSYSVAEGGHFRTWVRITL